jgi:hypothetical protein
MIGKSSGEGLFEKSRRLGLGTQEFLDETPELRVAATRLVEVGAAIRF